MKYAALYGTFIRSVACGASDAALGAWARMMVLASEIEAQDQDDPSVARLVGAAAWDDRKWLSATGTDKAGLSAATEAGLVTLDGDDVVLLGYDADGHSKVTQARFNGAKGGRPKSQKPTAKPTEKPDGFEVGNQPEKPTAEPTPKPLTSPTSPIPTFPSSPSQPSAQARESSPPAPWSEPGESVGWTAQAQRTAFVAAFEASQRTTPGMGGKAVGSFHADVLRTAELQGVEPGKLFRDTLARWLGAGLDETARRAPYACFQAAWGGLTSKGPSGPPAGPQAPQTASAARAAATEAMARGDMASVTALITRARELEDAEERRRGRR